MSTKDQLSSLKGGFLEQRSNKELIEGILFSLPYLATFSLFLLYPLLKGGYMSLFEWNPFFPSESEFIGVQNYARMMSDGAFWNSLGNTLYFVVLTVPMIVIFSLGLALGVNRDIKGRGVLRAVFFSPYILTVSVAALIWIELYATGYGPINSYLSLTGINPPAWLQSYTWAMPAIAFMTMWWISGFSFVILLSARQSVPEYLYEAAKLDGAGSWRAFRDITLPQMRHAIFFVVIINLVWSFQIFGQPYIMTHGGPGKETETLVMYLYNVAFNQRNFGYAAALGYVLTGILVVVSFANYYLFRGNNE
ncbi:carbohydrate ABC transporter permease [Halegenticoccus soli]|uniref:carbohydrate ABC transporter permease n=1 Tax=Halegenticoccus soli TaxID=1985678 RepID=UPI000C6D93AB|nr:sugar ABC transporter permease [Halegenticoccus soli]